MGNQVEERYQEYRCIAEGLFGGLQPTDDTVAYSRSVLDGVSGYGWLGVNIGQELGGSCLGHLERCMMIEATSSVSPSAGVVVQSAQLGTALPLYCAPVERDRFLSTLATGEDVATICMTERESGSNVAKMATTMDENGRVTGGKWFIVNSHVATLHGLVYRSSSAPDKGAMRVALVPATMDGVRPGMQHELAGLRGVNCGEVLFEDATVPQGCVDQDSNGMQLAL